MVPKILLLFLTLCCSILLSLCSDNRTLETQGSKSLQQNTDNENGRQNDSNTDQLIFMGKYINPTFGYSVRIPDGLQGMAYSGGSDALHGFTIQLSAQPEAIIWVDGSYNAAFYKSVTEAINTQLSFLLEEATNTFEMSRNEILLDNLLAMRAVVRYNIPKVEELVVLDLIVAVREEKEDIEYFYVLGLNTPESRYNQDKEVFDKLVASWRSEAPER